MAAPWRRTVRTGRTDLRVARELVLFDPHAVRILDVGSGDSTLATDVRAAGGFAVAVDPHFSLEPPRGRQCSVAALAESLPFRPGAFDVVVSTFCVQHTIEPVLALSEMIRVSRDEGLVAVGPLWRPRQLRGVDVAEIVPGRFAWPRRRPSLRVVARSETCRALRANGERWRRALRPHGVIALAGRAAMAVLIAVRGTTRLSRTSVGGARGRPEP